MRLIKSILVDFESWSFVRSLVGGDDLLVEHEALGDALERGFNLVLNAPATHLLLLGTLCDLS